MSSQTDPFAQLAALFMTEGDAPTPAPTMYRSAPLEILVVGHLPVRASLWLTSFADAAARQDGATALIRLDGDEPMIQILRGAPAAMPPERCRNLRETILHLGRSVRTWLVRPSARVTAAETLAAAPERLTILTGADQAATINAYRVIKEHAEVARDQSLPLPEIGLAVLGVDEASAHAMVHRVRQTLREHVTIDGEEVPLSLRLWLHRMDSGIRSSGLRAFAGQSRPEIDEVAAWIACARMPSDGTPDVTIADTVHPFHAAAPTELPSRSATGISPTSDHRPDHLSATTPPIAPDPRTRLTEPATASAPILPAVIPSAPIAPAAAAGGAPALDARSAPAPAPSAGARPAPGVSGLPLDGISATRSMKIRVLAETEIEGKSPADSGPCDEAGRPRALASHVTGLTPVLARCPGSEHVEIALDAQGKIHILAKDHAARALLVVSHWARAHRDLLAMACAPHAVDPAGRVVMHLFTDHPLKVQDLLMSGVHLHLLAPVDVGASRGWYSAPLNDPS